MLFDLDDDPDESQNLIATPAGEAAYDAIVDELLTDLRSVVDFESVALNVAEYGRDMFLNWMNRTADWESEINKKGLRWDDSFDVDVNASLAAIRAWLEEPGTTRPAACRHSLRWPPPSEAEVAP